MGAQAGREGSHWKPGCSSTGRNPQGPQKQAEDQEAERVGRHEAHRARASLLGSQLQGGSGSAPTAGHPAFVSHKNEPISGLHLQAGGACWGLSSR